MSRDSIPYATATSGANALSELQRVLEKFGCQSFGTMVDAERGCLIVQFRHRSRTVMLEASWQGYAEAWKKANPWSLRSRSSGADYEERALRQARISICSILRDWVKGQVTAVECGVMSFEAAFLPHMVTTDGRRLVDAVQAQLLIAENIKVEP